MIKSLLLVYMLLAMAVAGCGGSARVDITPLNYRAIDPPSATFSRIEPSLCVWWTDDSGRVWIAMEYERRMWFVPDPLIFKLSLALDDPPAGAARNYLVSRRELRGVARWGPAQARFVSIAGIVALYRDGDTHYRGAFRLDTAQQAQQVLGGWSSAERFLMLGEFRAAPDTTGRGKQIADETEAAGWERGEPSTRPAN